LSPILASPTLSYCSISTDDSDTLSYALDLSLNYQPCVLQPSFIQQLATTLCASIIRETYTPLRPLVDTYPHPHMFHSLSQVLRSTTHTLTPLSTGGSAMNMDTVSTTLTTRSLWTIPHTSSTPAMLSSFLTGPLTHTTPAFPSPCPTTPPTHPISHPHPLHCTHPHSPFLSVLQRTWSMSNPAFPQSHPKQPSQYWHPRRTSMILPMPLPLASSPLSTTVKSSMVSPL
jgi:hypothetical protein